MSAHGQTEYSMHKNTGKSTHPHVSCAAHLTPSNPTSTPASLWLVCSLPITPALQPGFNTTRYPPAPSSKHQTRPLP